MSTYQDNNSYHVWFESIEEMETEMPKLIAVKNQARWDQDVINMHAGRSWFYANSARDAMIKCRDGWPELVNELRPMIASLRQEVGLTTAAAVQIEVRRRKIRRSDSGDTLDMSRVWSGELETAWSKPVKYPRLSPTQRYATIFADCAASASVAAVDTLWRAAAAYCMIELLTGMGINTEIWTGATGGENWLGRDVPTLFRSGVRVKTYTQPINENRLATMLCAPFYRTWLFGSYMAGPWHCNEGFARVQNQGLPKPLADRKKAGERVFAVASCLSFTAAVRTVTQVITELRGDKAA